MKTMSSLMRLVIASLTAALASAAPALAWGASGRVTVISNVALSGPFATRSAWRFTATQGPDIDDPVGAPGDTAPGAISLCLGRGASSACDPQLLGRIPTNSPDDLFSEVHFLDDARIVHDAAGRPLLLVRTASVHSGDGDQLILTQALAYRRSADQFVRVYSDTTGRNRNEEVRFIETGALKGDIISAEPTENAPFGFWIVVNRPDSADVYRQVLRYRSATRYGDGNPLAVIDSEMANIEQRLGVWRTGSPLPLPAGACPTPHLVKMELWCR